MFPSFGKMSVNIIKPLHAVTNSLFLPQRETNPPSPGRDALTGAMETVSLATATVDQGLERGHVTKRP